VILSLQLPFAVIPLIQQTSDKTAMGTFANKAWVKILAWLSAITIVALNANLVIDKVLEWIETAGPGAIWPWVTVVPITIGSGILLLYVSLPISWRRRKVAMPQAPARLDIVPPKYARVGVAVDYGVMDGKVLSHAQMLAQQHGATVLLFHIVEGVSGQVFGKDAFDDEARQDKEHLEEIARQLQAAGLEVEPVLGYGRVPEQLIRLSKENNIDLLVMGGHGHRGLKDLIFGASISKVRHALSIPVLVVQ
jgi:manganese transport protein